MSKTYKVTKAFDFPISPTQVRAFEAGKTYSDLTKNQEKRGLELNALELVDTNSAKTETKS